jgi:hypothetical protein
MAAGVRSGRLVCLGEPPGLDSGTPLALDGALGLIRRTGGIAGIAAISPSAGPPRRWPREEYRPVDDGALGTPPAELDAESKPESGLPIAPPHAGSKLVAYAMRTTK